MLPAVPLHANFGFRVDRLFHAPRPKGSFLAASPAPHAQWLGGSVAQPSSQPWLHGAHAVAQALLHGLPQVHSSTLNLCMMVAAAVWVSLVVSGGIVEVFTAATVTAAVRSQL